LWIADLKSTIRNRQSAIARLVRIRGVVGIAMLPLSSQIELCRSLRHYLGAGLTLVDVFRNLASRGSAALRPLAERVLTRLQQGDDLKTALKSEEGRLPPLLLAMVQVGEESGNLPEICGELEQYLALQQRLRRQFWGQAVWPLFQLGAAVLVVAGLIFLLGILPTQSADGKAPDILGLGLVGASGAMVFLASAVGLIALVVIAYLMLTRVFSRKSVLDRALLRLPIMGPCLEALALSRICLALRLTLDSSLPIARALRLSLRAADNGAYESVCEDLIDAVKSGRGLAETLSRNRLFPWDFHAVLTVGEESGELPEAMGRLAKQYQEIAEHRLKLVTRAASWVVWLVVALIIIFVIFRIFTGLVLPMYQ
jgi:type II secretory pathway component PulF